MKRNDGYRLSALGYGKLIIIICVNLWRKKLNLRALRSLRVLRGSIFNAEAQREEWL